MNPKSLAVAMLSLCFSPAIAHARPIVGPDVEVYRPFSSKTRSTFGSTFTGVGLGFGSVRPSSGSKLRPDFALLREKESGNKATILIAGAEYRRTFDPKVEEDQSLVPYFGFGANLLYGSIEVPAANRDGNSFGAGGSVFIGSAVGKRAFVEGRLRALSSVESYNFSGLSLSAGLRF